MPLSVAQQPWLPRRSSVSSPSHTTTPSHSTLITPSSNLKGKDRSFDGADDFGCKYGELSIFLSLSRVGLRDQRGGNRWRLVPQAGQSTRTTTKQKSLFPLTHPLFRLDADIVGSKSSESSTSPTTYDSSSHSVHLHSHFQQYPSSLPSRHRMSLLSVASDAFGFRKKIGCVSRKKTNFHSLSHTSHIVPEVIEINACNNTTVTSTIAGTTAHRDYEHEERERLRDVAAQSIGLDPELLHDLGKSESRSSLDSPPSPPKPARLPPFPATLVALRPFTELSSTLPKFTPPSSLLVYALAKQWKPRIIVLTSHSPSHKTHVHLFKGSTKDEREIERLEVTENSVIFVPEEDVGGRRNVVKFAGKDVSAKRNGPSGEENLCTMWLLQITDPAESQRWIAAIKNAVLTQRYNC